MFKLFSKKKKDGILAPIDGKFLPLENVPDQVFSAKMMGDGVAIDTTGSEVYAPCDATVSVVAPTKHAYGLTLDNGVELLIHVGLDTVNLKGEGFEPAVQAGDKVKAGDLLVKVDRDLFVQNNISLITPVIVCNSAQYPLKDVCTEATVTAKETVLFRF